MEILKNLWHKIGNGPFHLSRLKTNHFNLKTISDFISSNVSVRWSCLITSNGIRTTLEFFDPTVGLNEKSELVRLGKGPPLMYLCDIRQNAV